MESVLDRGKILKALLKYLSKAFDGLPYPLLICTLHAYESSDC